MRTVTIRKGGRLAQARPSDYRNENLSYNRKVGIYMKVYVLLSIGYIDDSQHYFPNTTVVNVYSSKEKAEEYIATQGLMTDDESSTKRPDSWYYFRHEYDIQEEEVL